MKTESIVEIWERVNESPYNFANKFKLTIEELYKNEHESCYLFHGSSEDVHNARKAGYFYPAEFYLG